MEELKDHFRAQANWKGHPSRYWDKVESRIYSSPIAQELKRAESDVKRMKKEGQPMPREPILTRLKPQHMPSGKRNKKPGKTINRKVDQGWA